MTIECDYFGTFFNANASRKVRALGRLSRTSIMVAQILLVN